ncbi:23140_t:CDS:2 [Entrophospora sp. SA101]|nr:19130_t:CDS:2 [Entrophospora sp. SA101]CAJ0751329.1 23140_t:CDS:2 [Entrophospora sp. SA101]
MSTKRITTLTALQKKEICLSKQRDSNISNVELADIYNVGKSTVTEILKE